MRLHTYRSLTVAALMMGLVPLGAQIVASRPLPPAHRPRLRLLPPRR